MILEARKNPVASMTETPTMNRYLKFYSWLECSKTVSRIVGSRIMMP